MIDSILLEVVWGEWRGGGDEVRVWERYLRHCGMLFIKCTLGMNEWSISLRAYYNNVCYVFRFTHQSATDCKSINSHKLISMWICGLWFLPQYHFHAYIAVLFTMHIKLLDHIIQSVFFCSPSVFKSRHSMSIFRAHMNLLLHLASGHGRTQT